MGRTNDAPNHRPHRSLDHHAPFRLRFRRIRPTTSGSGVYDRRMLLFPISSVTMRVGRALQDRTVTVKKPDDVAPTGFVRAFWPYGRTLAHFLVLDNFRVAAAYSPRSS